MGRNLSLNFGLILILAGLLIGSSTSQANVIIHEKESVKFYAGGYAALDLFADTTQGIEEIVGSTPVARPGTIAGDTGRTIVSSRTSRFALGMITNRGSLTTKGHIEADFMGYQPGVGNGVSEAGYYQNPTLRLRHAYFLAEENGWSILAGQYWSLFGWQMDYISRTVSLPPMTGNLFARTPQLTIMKKLVNGDDDSVTFAVSVSRPSERDSEVPNLDGGIKIGLGGRKASYAYSNTPVRTFETSLAITGTLRQVAHPTKTASGYDTARKKVSAIAVDFILPLIAMGTENDLGNTLVLAGEYTAGSGYGDHFPRWTGNILNPNGSLPEGETIQQPFIDSGLAGLASSDGSIQSVKLKTWNLNMQYHLPSMIGGWVTLGAAELASPNAKDLKASGTAVVYDRQRGAYLNIVHNFTAELRVGAEYALMQTRYVDDVQAQNHRVQLTTWYIF